MIYSLFGAIAGGILLGYLCFDVSDKPALDTTLMTALNFMILVAGVEIGSLFGISVSMNRLKY